MTEIESLQARMVRVAPKSFEKMGPFRNLNSNLIKEYAGTAYGDNMGEDRLVRKLAQAIDGHKMLLGADRPAVLITSKNPQLTGFAHHFQLNLNSMLEEISFSEVNDRWLLDSLFCIGVTRAHMADSPEEQMISGNLIQDHGGKWIREETSVQVGQCTASNISLDNLLLDMAATDLNSMQYAGDKKRISWIDLQAGIEDGSYNSKAKKLKPTPRDTNDRKRLREISTGQNTDDFELEPMLDLADIWTRRDQMIRTYKVDRDFNIESEPIAKMKWKGRRNGPYHILRLGLIPENIMPSSMASHWLPMDQAINNLMQQQNRRAVQLKENPVYTPENKETAKNIEDARDMQWIKSNEPRETVVIRTGGADANTQAMIAKYEQQFDELTLNLTSQLGLGAQSDTVGQEQLIHSAGSRVFDRMKATYIQSVTGLVKSLAKMLWDDEYKRISNNIEVPTTEYVATSNWEPGYRMGKFEDYEFNVYSKQYQGPAERLQKINTKVTQLFAPMQETMSQQGVFIDMQKVAEMNAELDDLPRLREVITSDNPIPEAKGSGATKSPFSHREYVRKSSPGNPQRQAEQVTQMMKQPESNVTGAGQ